MGRPGRSWGYFDPSDARPLSRRIYVHAWDERKGSYVKCVEGDGRTSTFVEHDIRVLPDGASDDVLVTAAQEMAALHLKSSKVTDLGVDAAEKLTASLMTEAGFRLDDFYGQEAWLSDHSVEGFTIFIRGEPTVISYKNKGTVGAALANEKLRPDMPCEVGIACDSHHNTVKVVAPSLEDAIRVVEDGKLPLPSIMESWIMRYDDLYSGMKL